MEAFRPEWLVVGTQGVWTETQWRLWDKHWWPAIRDLSIPESLDGVLSAGRLVLISADSRLHGHRDVSVDWSKPDTVRWAISDLITALETPASATD